MSPYVPDCAGSITFPSWALHLPTVRSAALSYARKHLDPDFSVDPTLAFVLDDGTWHVNKSIADQFQKETFVVEENGTIRIGGWEPGGDLQNLRERLRLHGIPYDAEKLARGTGENHNDEKNYLRFDNLQRRTVKTVFNDNKSTAPSYAALRDLAASGHTDDLIRLIDAHLERIGPPTPLCADAPGPSGLLARLFACYAHAGNADAAGELFSEGSATLAGITQSERVRILCSIEYIFAQGDPDGKGSHLLGLCLLHGMKPDASDLAAMSKENKPSDEFVQQFRTVLAHHAVAGVLATRQQNLNRQDATEAKAWMHFPAWALWLDNVRFELERMLGQKPELPLRTPGWPVHSEGRPFNLDTVSAAWKTDRDRAASVPTDVATRFAIENDRVILEGSDPAAVAWNKLQGILSVLRVPMNHLKEGTERHYRYEDRDVEQIHQPARDHNRQCTRLEDYCHQGALGAYHVLKVDASRGVNFEPLRQAMPGVLDQLTNEQKYEILAECLRSTSKSRNPLAMLTDAGLTMPPKAVDWLQAHYATRTKPANYEEHLKLVGALQARQGLQAVITKARAATP